MSVGAPWTRAEDLRIFYCSLPARTLAAELGRTEAAVRRRRWILRNPERQRNVSGFGGATDPRAARERWRRNGGSRPRSDLDGASRGNSWLPEEDARVLAHSVPDRQLAAELGRSITAVQVRRWRLNHPGQG